MLAKAREEGLLVHDLPDETLVYDLERNKAHCLNQTAAFVWRQCDGQTTVGEIARRLPQHLQLPPEEEVVWVALSQLEKAHLLCPQPALAQEAARYSRRDLVRKLGAAQSLCLP